MADYSIEKFQREQVRPTKKEPKEFCTKEEKDEYDADLKALLRSLRALKSKPKQSIELRDDQCHSKPK